MQIRLFVLSVLLVLCGCADTNTLKLDTAGRKPTTHVDVFRAPPSNPADTKDWPHPPPNKVIGEVTFKGSQADELKATKYFVEQARKMGGNAIIMGQGAGEYEHAFGAMGGQVVLNFMYKALIIVYEP